MRPSGAGLGNMFGQECTFSYMYTCIGYKLPTFGDYMLVGGFLCALRPQGWGICLVNRQVPGGQFPPGQVTWPGSCPGGSCQGGSCLLAVLVSEVQNVWMHIQTSIGREEEFK